MATTLEQLISKLSVQQPYTAMTQEEINEAANRRYQSVYDQKRLSAQQAYETSDAALARELADLQTAYDTQRAQSAARTESTYRQADRQSLSRGMQRSSYNSATLANIGLSGSAELNAITQEQTQKEGDIGEQRTQLSRQLAGQLAQYDADQQNDAQAYADELEQREYERSVQSISAYNDLAMKLYEYQHELEKEAQEQARWLAEFNAKYGKSTSSGGGGSGSSKKTKKVATTATKGGSHAGMNAVRVMAM